MTDRRKSQEGITKFLFKRNCYPLKFYAEELRSHYAANSFVPPDDVTDPFGNTMDFNLDEIKESAEDIMDLMTTILDMVAEYQDDDTE